MTILYSERLGAGAAAGQAQSPLLQDVDATGFGIFGERLLGGSTITTGTASLTDGGQGLLHSVTTAGGCTITIPDGIATGVWYYRRATGAGAVVVQGSANVNFFVSPGVLGSTPSQTIAEKGVGIIRVWRNPGSSPFVAFLGDFLGGWDLAGENLIGLVETFEGHIVTGVNKTFTLCEKAAYPFTINSLSHKLASGTITAAIKINAVNVTGLSALGCSSTQAETAATGANSVSLGQRVTMELSANSTALDLAFSLKVTRA